MVASVRDGVGPYDSFGDQAGRNCFVPVTDSTLRSLPVDKKDHDTNSLNRTLLWKSPVQLAWITSSDAGFLPNYVQNCQCFCNDLPKGTRNRARIQTSRKFEQLFSAVFSTPAVSRAPMMDECFGSLRRGLRNLRPLAARILYGLAGWNGDFRAVIQF